MGRCQSFEPEPEKPMTLSRATPRKHGDWSLLINALVEIRQNGQVIRTGFVEDVMPDSSVLWLASDRDNPAKCSKRAKATRSGAHHKHFPANSATE